MSYNSMGIMTLAISFVIASTARKYIKIQMFVSGIFFAMTVLCCPYMIIAFVIYLLVSVILVFTRNKGVFGQKYIPLLEFKNFTFFTCGCIFSALIVCILILSRSSISEIISVIPHIFDDPEHPSRTVIDFVYNYIAQVLTCVKFSLGLFGLCALLLSVIIVDKKRFERRKIYMSLAIVIYLAFSIMFIIYDMYINKLMFAINILGFFSYILTKNKNYNFMNTLWIGGIIYGFCISMSSNQGFYVISSAMTVSTLASCIFIYNLLCELSAEHAPCNSMNKIVSILSIVCLVFQFFTMSVSRYLSVFWEAAPIYTLNESIECGVAKGIFTTEKNKEMYENYYKDTELIRKSDAKCVLYISTKSWFYIDDTKSMGTYSGWQGNPAEHMYSRLQAYYTLDDRHIPEVVFIDNDAKWAVDNKEKIANDFEYYIFETDCGYILKK